MDDAIVLKDVCKLYRTKGADDVTALNHVSLSIGKGEFVSICGVSGSGKSTLLNIICGIDSISSGEVFVSGTCLNGLKNRELAKIRSSKIGIVIQDFALIPYRTAYDNVMVPFYFGNSSKNVKSLIMNALEKTGVSQLAKREVRKMSGGQKQRVAIARAIVKNPDIILADEPTGQLDSATKKDIGELFRTLNREGKTVVVVTHDTELASLADRVIWLKDGVVVDK